MTRPAPIPLLATLTLAFAVAPAARADLVVIPFSAILTGGSGGFTAGDPVTGQVSYDPAAVISSTLIGPGFVSYSLPVVLSLSLGSGYSFSGTLATRADVHDTQPGSGIGFGDTLNFQSVAGPDFTLFWTDPTGTALGSPALPAANPEGPGLYALNYSEGSGARARGFGATPTGEIYGATPVPEPETFGLAALGTTGIGLYGLRRRGSRRKAA